MIKNFDKNQELLKDIFQQISSEKNIYANDTMADFFVKYHYDNLEILKKDIDNLIAFLLENKRIIKIGDAFFTSEAYHNNADKELFVYCNQELIGFLGFNANVGYTFAYDTEYVLEKSSSPILLPLSFKIYESRYGFIDFLENIPEGIDKNILENKIVDSGVEAITYFDLLAQNTYSKNQIMFLKNKIQTKKQDLVKYENIKDEILGKNSFPNILKLDINIDDNNLFPNIANYSELKTIRNFSISGFQHKLAIIIDNNEIRLPKIEKNNILLEEPVYFIKPYNKYKIKHGMEHMAINEHLHLTFAKNELGFDVPYSGICKREKDIEFHYIVKFFDRIEQYHFPKNEIATYLNLNADNKYKTSSEKMFKKFNEILANKNEKLRVLEYYFYSFLIKHEDMHTKNISVFNRQNKCFVAPLYDVCTTGIYNMFLGLDSHLTINGKQKNIRFKDFLELAKRLELNETQILEPFRNIAQKYIDEMPKYFLAIKEKIGDLEMKIYSNSRMLIDSNVFDSRIGAKRTCRKSTLESELFKNYFSRLKMLRAYGWEEKLKLENISINLRNIDLANNPKNQKYKG